MHLKGITLRLSFMILSTCLLGLPVSAGQLYGVGHASSNSKGVIVARGFTDGFDEWLQRFKARAIRNGIPESVYDRAVRDVKFNPYVIKMDRNQAEFTKPVWDYLDVAVSDARVRDGKRAKSRHKNLLQQIEQKYGVDHEIVLAIWGLESAYGKRKGDIPVIEALATLAYDGRRRKFFEGQLISALKILSSGDIAPGKMVGSWAGAMGHTQFIPTSYQSFAQDFDRDGKRNIWGRDPGDSLASTAHYLARHGWRKNQPWGVEVMIPEGFDYARGLDPKKRPVGYWNRMGVRTVTGEPVPNYGRSKIIMPGGAGGPAFVVFHNFHVIERYNTADAYVLAVGHLGDRIRGGGSIKHDWPRHEKTLDSSQLRDLQRRLNAEGFGPLGVDGILGPETIASIRRYQGSAGLVQDGFPTLSLLNRLR